MLVSLALVLAPALTPRHSLLKDAMAQLDGALKSLDTDTAEKGVIMEGVMGATSEQSNALQPASEPAVLPSVQAGAWAAAKLAAAAAEELAPLPQLPAAAVALRGAAIAQQSSEAPLLEVPQATSPVAAAATLEANEVVPPIETATEWEDWDAQRHDDEGAADEGQAEDRWRTDGAPIPFPVPVPSSEPPPDPTGPSPEPIPSPSARAARIKMRQPQPAADVKSRLDEWRGRAAQSTTPITVLLLSDRVLPVQVAFGSILLNTNSSLMLFVIGENITGLQDQLEETLPLRTDQNLTVIAMADAEAEIAHLNPPWMSADNGQSINNASWRTSHTILQREWDHDPMHSTRFNLLRFYIPYLEAFADTEVLLFMDDDVIVTGDVAQLAYAPVPPEAVVVGQCDNFAWNDECQRFMFFEDGRDWSSLSATLYLQNDLLARNASHVKVDAQGRSYEPSLDACPHGDEALCGPELEEHHRFLKMLYTARNSELWNTDGEEIDFTEQPVWNFGLTRLNLTAWKQYRMTETYRWWLNQNNKNHLFPEDSLAYGLGIPYLAFAGHVVCWNDYVDRPARDALGYITMADFKAQGIDEVEYLNHSIFLHYSGRRKPWNNPGDRVERVPHGAGHAHDLPGDEVMHPKMLVEPELAAPFYDVMRQLNLPLPPARPLPPPRQKHLLVTEPRSGSEWMMDLLDAHPAICSSGERDFPTNGFARESMVPGRWDLGIDDCSLKRGCMWSFVAKYVPLYVRNYVAWCPAAASDSAVASGEGVSQALHDTHGERLCAWAEWWNATYTWDVDPFTGDNATNNLWLRYEQAIYDDNDGLVPCSCNGEQHMVLKFMRGWAQKLTPHEHAHTNASSYYTGNFHDHVQTTAALRRAGEEEKEGGSVVAGPVLDWSEYKIVELRRNTFDVCMSLLVSLHSGVWHEEALSPSESVDEYVPIEVNATELAHCMWYVEEERNNGQVTQALDERRAAGMLLTLHYEDCVGVGLDVCYSRAVHFITDTNATADANPLTADAPMVHPPASDYCPDCDKATCDDAWDFVDSHGLGCDAWAGYDCSDDMGPHCDGRNYTDDDMAAIRLACPNACDVCEEGGEASVKGEEVASIDLTLAFADAHSAVDDTHHMHEHARLNTVTCADPCTAFGLIASAAACPFASCASFSNSACAWKHCKRAGHLQPSGHDRYALIEGDDQCPSTVEDKLKTIEDAVITALTAALGSTHPFEVTAMESVPNATAADHGADLAVSIQVLFYAKVSPGHPDYHPDQVEQVDQQAGTAALSSAAFLEDVATRVCEKVVDASLQRVVQTRAQREEGGGSTAQDGADKKAEAQGSLSRAATPSSATRGSAPSSTCRRTTSPRS